MISSFHKSVGKTIMLCQQIEHDVKVIYASLLGGDFIKNFNSNKKNTLGETIFALEQLDKGASEPFFSPSDYKILKVICNIRNYWAHNGYEDFIYLKFSDRHSKIKSQKEKIKADYKALKPLAKRIAKQRKKIVKKYGL